MAGKARGRKAIFITGAASGMGRETAKLFAGKGWFVGAYRCEHGRAARRSSRRSARTIASWAGST